MKPHWLLTLALGLVGVAVYGGDCLTSIAAGAGAVWVTVAAARPDDAAAATNWNCPGRPQ